MKQEVFEIRDYLVENNYPQGLINILDDYFTNKAKQIKGYTVATNCNWRNSRLFL